MFTSDQQILKLPEVLISKGIISGTAEFFEETGILKSYFSQVKNQEKYDRPKHFTPAQIEKTCLLYSVNFNWVFGVSKDIFVKKDKRKTEEIEY